MNGKELRRSVRGVGAALLPTLVGRLPVPVGRRVFAGVGWIAHWTIRRDRRLARRNLALVHAGWSPRKVRREALKVFQEIGRNAYDFVRYPDLSEAAKDSLIHLEGRAYLDLPPPPGAGTILVTGHLGSWEVLAAHLVREGYPLKALARPLREPRLDRLLSAHRRRMGVETLSSSGSPLPAVRHLKRGGMLGILVDQRVRRAGTEVEFLGRPTRMTEAPARLALGTGSRILPVAIQRLPDHAHRVRVLPPLEVPGGNDSVRAITQAIAAALEGLIRQTPEQWIWIHPRWEDRNSGDGGSGNGAAATGRDRQ